VNPVDPRPALLRIVRTIGAEHDDRHAIAPGTVERHRRVHQTDVGVDHGKHRLAGDLRVAVCDRNRVLFVQTHQHLRILRVEIIDEAIV